MPISKICNYEDWNHNQVFLYVYDHRSIIATFKNTCCSKNSCWILIFLRVLRHDPSLVLSHYRGVALKWAWRLEQNVPPAHLVLQILRHSLLNVPLLTTEIFLPHVLLSENSNTENKFVHDAANEQQSN